MAKWTLQDYLTALRDQIDEPETDYFTDTELTRYLNHATANMSHELQLEDYTSYTLTNQNVVKVADACPSSSGVVGDTDFLQVRLLSIDGNVLEYGKLEDIQQGKDVFVIWGDSIRFANSKSGLLEVYFLRKAKTMTALTDTTDVPELYQEVPIFFAASQCFKKDGQIPIAQQFMSDYETRKAEMKAEIDFKTTDDNGSSVNITYLNGSDI